MPIYEFRCNACSTTFESLQRSYNSEGVRCPECGSDRLARLISSFAVAQGLTPCGTRASDAPASCGIGSGGEACSSCCRLGG
ncbi:MAG: zinc ribbon domain-containing protein [Chthonomonadales bacterium]|nr:zinc ribbon domain-containing protein [Chthonomonadales bacterium]